MSVIKRLLAAVAAMAFVLVFTKATMRSDAQYQAVSPPKDIVTAFEKQAFADRHPRQAALRYVSPALVDHDPATTGSREGFIARIETLGGASNAAASQLEALAADGDLVFVQRRLAAGGNSPALGAVDVFRVKDGLIQEHWNVVQALPASSQNPRAML